MSGYPKSHWNYNHSLASLDPSLLCFSLMTKWVISMLLCCSLATIYWHAHTMWTHIWLSIKQHMHTLLTQITQCIVIYSTVSNYPHTLYTHVDKVIFYAFKCKHSRMTHTCSTRPLSRTNTRRLHRHVIGPTCAVWGSREDDLYLAAALSCLTRYQLSEAEGTEQQTQSPYERSFFAAVWLQVLVCPICWSVKQVAVPSWPKSYSIVSADLAYSHNAKTFIFSLLCRLKLDTNVCLSKWEAAVAAGAWSRWHSCELQRQKNSLRTSSGQVPTTGSVTHQSHSLTWLLITPSGYWGYN